MADDLISKRVFARPLRFDLDVDAMALFQLIGTLAFDDAARRIMAHLAAEAAASPDGGWIHYARARNWYSNRRYLHEVQTYANVMRAVAGLEKEGLIEHVKSEPGRRGTESLMRASRRLLQIMPSATQFLNTKDPEVIYLMKREQTFEKNGRKWTEPARSIPYEDTDGTRRMRRDLRSINEGVAGVELRHPKIGIIRPGTPIPRLGKSNPGPAFMGMRRKFTERFDQHGRFYAWWQNLPGKERGLLLLDGERVIEEDYRQIHPTLLYGMRGIRLECDFDAYTVDGLPPELRPLLKVVFNAMVNARGRQGLHFTITDRARELTAAGEIPPGFDGHAAAVLLMDAMLKRHATIEDAFFSDAGLTLMRADSDMAEDVMLTLLRDGIVSLGIHDSFIVQARHGGKLTETMERAKAVMLDKMSGRNVVKLTPRKERVRNGAKLLIQNEN
ncbi:hypothetical protein G5V57_03050 [Nordella sp. HKS 07]|uniref:hypothetical protein n=1 Tax=Nordella sp. HKS 07 TaxID=2712222 RepID=UPI0013E1628D|nr:hypothetical protein [Nordella sp. HKS 07]QIG46814.1 hypothetical protein G5V57_03050 [Nordella sp. HKS 07]